MTMSDTGRDPGALGLPDDEPDDGGRGGDIGGRGGDDGGGDDWGDRRADETGPDGTSPEENTGEGEPAGGGHRRSRRVGPGPGRGGDIGGRIV